MMHEAIVRQYALLGLTAFLENLVESKRMLGEPVKMIIVGQLEWFAILDCEPTDEYSIAGVPVVPDMNIQSIVSVT